jgi:3-methylfumaryl-CoA hydratase
MLDRDTGEFVDGMPLPRGWHPIFFNPPTAQSRLRDDGATELGVPLPDVGLPRLMLGGRSQRFLGEIPIGARLRRESIPSEVVMKTGRSGPFAVVGVEHRIFVAESGEPAVIEQQQYILRPAASADPTSPVPPASAPTPERQAREAVLADKTEAFRTLLPDERMLFRYSAITDNPHRIHYDRDYSCQAERYPDLVVNGTIPAMFLLEMFRQVAGHEPSAIDSRNLAPMYCNRPLSLSVNRDDGVFVLRAQDASGQICYEARAS